MAKDNRVDAITNLLKSNDSPLSAVKANKLLLQIGILEEKERESSTRAGVMKKYKSLTTAGLIYGINYENPQSPEQTSPYYFKENFAELHKLLIQQNEQEIVK